VNERHKIINLIHPDAAETPYGWANKIFYDAKEHIKALGNKMGDTTAIRGEEFKPFDKLTMRCIKTSKLGQLI
jgi:hypothetical protein